MPTIAQKIVFSHYVQNQKRALQDDWYYKQILEKINKIMAYRPGNVYGYPHNMTVEPSDDIKALQEMVDILIATNYPVLHRREDKPGRPYNYMPDIYLDIPFRLSLQQIDERLTLFKDYMRYRLEYLNEWPCMIMYAMKSLGMFYHYEGQMLSFDEWLYVEGWVSLVKIDVYFV